MIKRGCIAILILFLIVILFLSSAQIDRTVTEKTQGLDPANPLNLPTDVGEVKNKSKEKWDYLSSEWQRILLKNERVAKFDSFMKKVDDKKIFYYLMGESYTLTLSFFILLLMWVFFGSRFGELVSSYFNFKEWERALVWIGSGIAFSIAMSLSGIYKLIIYLPRSQYLKDVAWWVAILIWVVFIIIIVILYYFMGNIKRFLIKRIKKEREKRTKQHEEKIEEFSEGIMEK
ncbi:hypothetical protein HYV49_05535 [Candidatus Pacearchaeota archaeon]|nr:hypothetical protein [Candidatus Pacearchaeota archaeon]